MPRIPTEQRDILNHDAGRDLISTFELPAAYNDQTQDSASLLISPDERAYTVPGDSSPAMQECKSELASGRTRGLRRASVLFSEKWQIDVLRRLGEVLSVRPEEIRQARRQTKFHAESATKRETNEKFLRWANGEDGEEISKPNAPRALSDRELLEELKLSIFRLPQTKRTTILSSLLLLLLSLERYTAHSRTLLFRDGNVFEVPPHTLQEKESEIAQTLLASAATQMSADESTKKKADEDAANRKWKVGLATVAGAALIGVTGGLAAPILAAGLGSIMGGIGLGAVATLLGPLATNMVLVGGLFGAYGGRMTGRAVEKYAQEIRDFAFLPLRDGDTGLTKLNSNISEKDELADEETLQRHKLSVAIGVSGALVYKSEAIQPWQALETTHIEGFALRWETEALLELGTSVNTVLQKYAWDFAKLQVVSIFLAGLWPLGLLQIATSLDNPFSVAKNRSDKAGKVLADALINRAQGERPVTLLGYSMGARVIYSCLLELADQNAFGLVENVILMGAPVPSNPAEWRRMRSVVTSRVVNAYSQTDFMLAFLYRSHSAQLSVAGLQPIPFVNGVESVDISAFVSAHNDYASRVALILNHCGFEDVDGNILTKQRTILQHSIEQKEQARSEEKAEMIAADNQMAKEVDGHIVLVDEEGNDLNEKAFSQLDGQDAMRPDVSSPLSARDPVREAIKGLERVNLARDQKEKTEEEPDGPIELTSVEPEPEDDDDDAGPERETLQFGTTDRGFKLEWDSRPRAG